MTFTSGAFLSQKRNKKNSHELHRTVLLAALFLLLHQVEKDSYKHHKMTQTPVSFSYQ